MLFAVVFGGVALATARRASYGIAALILLQPFALAHYLAGTTITLPKVALVGVLLGLVPHARWKEALGARSVRAILIALAVLTCLVAASGLDALHRDAVLRETLKWIEYSAIFVAVCLAYERDPNDALLVRCWIAVTLIVTVAALAQEFAGAPSGTVISGHVVPRIAGPLEGPNQLAGYLESSLAILCAWYRRERVIAVTIGIALCALALTFSRGGIVATCVLLGVILWARGWTRAILAPISCGAVAGALLVWLWITLAHLPRTLPSFSLSPAPIYAGGVGYRAELWHAAIMLWQRHPLLGVGAGNYQLELGSAGLQGVRTHANSWYLQALVEGGILLFLATLALLATILATLGRRIREAKPWQLAAYAASLAFVVHQLVDYLVFYPKVAGAWWIVVALGASAMRRSCYNVRPVWDRD